MKLLFRPHHALCCMMSEPAPKCQKLAFCVHKSQVCVRALPDNKLDMRAAQKCGENMGQKITKEVFDKFFTENYCAPDYATVKKEFEEIADAGNEIFTGSYEARNLKRDNFILYLTSESYCDFEAIVQEALDDLNPEILDAVMDVTEAQPDGDEVTERYWDTIRELIHEFLLCLYDEVICRW